MTTNSFRSFYHRKADPAPIDISKFATVNADRPSERVSSSYRFIPTTRPLAVLADYGWLPVAVQETRTRDEANAGYQRHIVRLSHPSLTKEVGVGGTIPQILLGNDHTGNGAFEFLVGLFEKVCANNLCVNRGDAGRLRVLHRGYADAQVELNIRQVMAELPDVLGNVDRFKAINLSRDQQEAYAESAIELRWDGEAFAVEPSQVLTARHLEQKAPTLWNTFNRVQEAVIRGGVRQVNADGRRTRARAVKSVGEDLRLNRALWALTSKMAELVG